MGISRSQKQASTTNSILFSLMMGGALTGITAPVINAFNRASVASSRYNLTGVKLFAKIYSGELNLKQKKSPGYHNFLVGLKPHLIKEFIRLGYKAPGLGVYFPWLETHFSPNQATQIYAISMSFAEMVINPVDTWRVVLQSGDSLVKTLSRLYSGAGLNGLRQYGVWATVGYNNMLFDPIMQNYGIDPYGLSGILIKAYPQAAINIFTVYPLERIKNELQFGTLPSKSTVWNAACEIYKKQGWMGFFRGCLVKTPGGAVQHAAALTVLAWGKKRLAKQTEDQNDANLTMSKR